MNKVPSEKNFSIVFFIFFQIIGIYFIMYGSISFQNILFNIFGFLILFLGFFFPKIIRIPNILWYRFGLLLNSVISPFIMFIIFLLTVIPIGLIFKLLKKDLLDQKYNFQRKSYWLDVDKDKTNLDNQF